MKKILILLLTFIVGISLFACTTPKINPSTPENEDDKIVEYKKPTNNKKYTVKLLSDPKDEDPWHPEFNKNDLVWKAKLQKTIIDIREKYDVNIEFEKYNGNYIEDIEKRVATTNADASIARISTNEGLIKLVAKGMLANIDKVAKLDENDKIVADPSIKEYLDTSFQLKVGQISQSDNGKTYTKQYAISRHKLTSLFNMALYNADILERAGIYDDPVELWKQGKWTWAKMEEMKEKILEWSKGEGGKDFIKENKPRSEGGKPYGFSFQFYLFDLIPQRFGKTIGLENIRETWVKDQIAEFARMWRAGENQTAMWEEMSWQNNDAKTLEDIKYKDSWAQRWRADNWSPNQHGGSKCFEIGKTAFTIAEPWMYQDAILGVTQKPGTRGKVKLMPIPTEDGSRDKAKITGLSGDLLAITKGNNSELAAKVMMELNKAWVEHFLDLEVEGAKRSFEDELKGKTDTEIRTIVKSGELKAKQWVKTHLLSNGNISAEELDDQVEVYKYYSDPKRLTENRIDKYGFLIPYLDAVHSHMVDKKDLESELELAEKTLKETIQKLIEELKK